MFTLRVTSVPSSYSPLDGLIVPPSVGLDETLSVYIVGGVSSVHPIKKKVLTIKKNILFIILTSKLIPKNT